MNRIDLHVHSSCSDGTLRPGELVHLAKAKRLVALSVTDHDTAVQNEEALREGKQVGIDVIPGIEVSAEYSPGTLHLLGYFIDSRSPELSRLLESAKEARQDRNPQIAEKLQRLGFAITLEEVERKAQGGQVGRPHFAAVLVEKGLVKSVDEAFDLYLGKGKVAYVDKRRFSAPEIIRAIHRAEGVAVLAHPKQIGIASARELEQFVRELVREGLDGIEAYSSDHHPREAALYRSIGERHQLLITGGSDFHGDQRPGVDMGFLGEGAELTEEVVLQMRQALRRFA